MTREDGRISTNECAIAGSRTHDEATAHPIGLVVADRDCGLRRPRELPVEIARHGSDVGDDVGALDHRQTAAPVVAKEHIDRVTAERGPDRQLERPPDALPLGESKKQLLHRQVPHVRRLLDIVALHLDPKAKVEGHGQPLPGIDRVAATLASLQRTNRCPCQPHATPELGLRQAPAPASRTNGAAEPRQLLLVPSPCLGSQFLSLELDHARCMVAGSACLAISRKFARRCVGLGPLRCFPSRPIERGGPRLRLHKRGRPGLIDHLPLAALTQRARRAIECPS
jgi:hypothetical protein